MTACRVGPTSERLDGATSELPDATSLAALRAWHAQAQRASPVCGVLIWLTRDLYFPRRFAVSTRDAFARAITESGEHDERIACLEAGVVRRPGA